MKPSWLAETIVKSRGESPSAWRDPSEDTRGWCAKKVYFTLGITVLFAKALAQKTALPMRLVQYLIVTSACALAIMQTNLPAAAESIPVGPVADAFYAPPLPLPLGKRGSVIWARALDGTMALPSAPRNILALSFHGRQGAHHSGVRHGCDPAWRAATRGVAGHNMDAWHHRTCTDLRALARYSGWP